MQNMRKRSFELTEAEVQQFRRTEQQTRDAHELRRLQGVRMYGSGESLPHIQEVTNAAERTIREWVQRYNDDGIAGLASHWQGGNANQLSREQRVDLAMKLNEYTPDQVIGIIRIEQGVFWTVSDLRIVVQEWYGVSYRSESSYYNLLHSCGLSYQKAEKVFRSQPSAERLADFEAELEKK
jgi:transposase